MHSDTTISPQIDPFTARFGVPLPRGLREEAGDMSWASFCQTYERSGGALRLGQWSQTGGTYQATLTIGECIESSTVSACGPMAALTAMLSERGIRMETLSFHQLRDGDQTCTFIRGTNGLGTAWAMGRAPDATTSSLKAVTACANRLAR
ncbi:hypothetical protein [Mycobacteroides abscessus]|uniref:2-isopropylmalate synthase n=7 Tax=Mycobacteroides abscessus TaxID=36809 RepID=A0A829HPM9_9MYCO|nr:hypothetical protein [Mycobacteroides abscessus]ESV56260.1 hypothetical protein L830_2084 [Mycobacteroides abscessus MAB_082312_2258]EUA68198.1 hypothetical protein I540_3981 [Mycobacteroides abscessus subsp. bolletii 1513]AGM29971.1 hypothetical protein MASS_3369 [Mycobacteroides abscessus subsp. bolletii 50594]AIC71643.1 hypothetical protein MYCMA_06240 [Mycobacteroides abscessus subsp. massiliense str. GO 06]AMU27210.1 hypothetical protein A3N96_18925 [Mycobacteroides abscessus]